MELERLLTRKEVEEQCRIGRSAVYRWMREHHFPLPIKIGPRAVRWHASEIEAWLADRPRASGNEQTAE